MANLDVSALRSSAGVSGFGRLGDLSLAVVALLVIAMMVLPLPPWVLDTLVAVNIASGITLLLFALYVSSPMAFSTFPSVLLFVTLFRIALNVATTRQILLNAHAGEIIDTFGRVVVGGSLLVGMVIFLIITVVQFVVIAKGSERVAEVGARFTLDAMPGKQIAIDSDLRAGLISQAEALRQRHNLGLESQFYGSMDGAMKFVKGDAIASIVIVAVNLLGGMAVGVLVNDMSAGDAVARYSVLSIGDGLVTQIPALFISMAAGIVVTRSADDDNEHLAAQISRQFGAQPRSLILAGVAITLFGLVPGFPILPFLLIGATIAWIGYRQGKTLVERLASDAGALVPMAAADGDPNPARVTTTEAASYALLALRFNPAAVRRQSLLPLNDAIGILRQRWRFDIGVPFPGVGLRTAEALDEREIQVQLGESVVSSLRLDAPVTVQTLAQSGTDLLNDVVRQHAARMVGIQEARWLLNQTERTYPDLVREAGRVADLPTTAGILAELVAGGVPLRDMRSVLETLVARHTPETTRVMQVERIRQACSQLICESLVAADGSLSVMILAADAEQALSQESLAGNDPEQPAQWTIDIIERLSSAIKVEAARLGPDYRPVLLASMSLRAGLQRQLPAFVPGLRIISHAEVAPGSPLKAVASIALPKEPLPLPLPRRQGSTPSNDDQVAA
ncbi:MAG: FHIPEP family type III secretion protein [Burkholderiaceae bacterium]